MIERQVCKCGFCGRDFVIGDVFTKDDEIEDWKERGKWQCSTCWFKSLDKAQQGIILRNDRIMEKLGFVH